MRHLERVFLGKNQIWRYIVLLLIVFIGGSLIGGTPLAIVRLINEESSGNTEIIASDNPMDLSKYGLSNNAGLAIMLFTFVTMFLFFALLVKPFHQRTLSDTINGGRKLRWGRIGMGILVWGLLLVVSFYISLYNASPTDYEFRFNPSAIFGLIIVVLILMPFQTSTEEVVFRGYLAQGVARYSKSRWLALLIPSILFALAHATNPEVEKFGFWLMMPNYLLMGLLFGLISILDDGIELALGVHFINNALGSVLVTYDSSVLQTDALYKLRTVNPEQSLIETLVSVVLAIFIFQQIYKWDFGILNKKVQSPIHPSAETHSSAADVKKH